MPGRIQQILQWMATTAVVMLGGVSVASAQVPPNPPTGVTIGDGASEPTDPGSPGNPIFFDDFGYVVNKTDPADTKRARFSAAGWSGVKDEQVQPGRSFGYLSTVSSIPGYSGRIPGRSGRALRMEGLPTTLGDFSSAGNYRNQTDFYLSYGSASGPQTNVPGNVWFQFWVYVNDYGSERSHWAARNKIIYPSDDGTASGDGMENAYMLHFRPSNQAGITQPYGPNMNGVAHMEGSVITSSAPEGASRLGHNRSSSGHQTGNGWYLHKFHIDHSQTNGVYEHWIRPMGGQWRKTTEWIGGVTPGFTWITHAHERPGHNMFKLGTTWGTAQGDDRTNYDAWLYLADFAMAGREADLPTYDTY